MDIHLLHSQITQLKFMQIKTDKNHIKELRVEKLKRRADGKKFNAAKHRGKVNFKEDGLAFQKRVREEWDERRM